MDAFFSLAVTMGLMLTMLGVWLAVQRVWGQAFGVNDDVLAARGTCGACTHAASCLAGEICDKQRTTPTDKVN